MSDHARLVAFLQDDARQVTMMNEPLDLAGARAFLLATAVEMYLEDGHSSERAEVLAQDLLQSEVEFDLPELFDD